MEIIDIPVDELVYIKLITSTSSRLTFKLKRKCRLSSECVRPRTPSVISVRSYGCGKSEPEAHACDQCERFIQTSVSAGDLILVTNIHSRSEVLTAAAVNKSPGTSRCFIDVSEDLLPSSSGKSKWWIVKFYNVSQDRVLRNEAHYLFCHIVAQHYVRIGHSEHDSWFEVWCLKKLQLLQ